MLLLVISGICFQLNRKKPTFVRMMKIFKLLRCPMFVSFVFLSIFRNLSWFSKHFFFRFLDFFSFFHFNHFNFFEACSLVVKYITSEVTVICDSVDGGNLSSILTEFGQRFYRAILSHIYQFTYNSQGAMLLLCDINEYRYLYFWINKLIYTISFL